MVLKLESGFFEIFDLSIKCKLKDHFISFSIGRLNQMNDSILKLKKELERVIHSREQVSKNLYGLAESINLVRDGVHEVMGATHKILRR